MKLSADEMIKIAEAVRIRITGGKGITLEQYASLASSMKGDEIGLFYLWAIRQNNFFNGFFPDDILKIFSSKLGRHYYSEEDNDFIRQNASYGIKFLVFGLNVPPHSAYKQARLLGVKVPRSDYTFYSEEENQRVLEEGLTQRDSDLSKKLNGRSARSVQIKRLKAGLKKKELFHWKDFPEKESYLMRNYQHKTYDEIASTLGLRYYQVKTKAERLRREGKL